MDTINEDIGLDYNEILEEIVKKIYDFNTPSHNRIADLQIFLEDKNICNQRGEIK